MYSTWTQDDRNTILDAIRADLTGDEILEIETLDNDEFARFVGRLFTIVHAEFS